MMVTASRFEVVQFLGEFRAAALTGNYYMVPREKNLQAIENLGLTPNDAREVILSLSVANYSAGPEQDDDDPKQIDVWKFGCDIDKTEIYIKLRLAPGQRKDQHVAKVLSFHPAAYKISFFY